MAKADFKQFMVRDVEFMYPRLNKTYKYNTAEKRQEECNPRAQGAAYSIAWKLDKDRALQFYNELKAHHATCGQGEFKTVFGMKKQDDGSVVFSAKRKGVNSKGEENSPPTVIDGAKQPLADTAIWGGSKGSIRVVGYPTTDPDGVSGISLLIDTVQVTEPVYGGGGLDDFETIETPKIEGTAGNDPFAAAAPAPANADLDDDLPF